MFSKSLGDPFLGDAHGGAEVPLSELKFEERSSLSKVYPAREEVMRIWLKVELDLLSHSQGYQTHSDLL